MSDKTSRELDRALEAIAKPDFAKPAPSASEPDGGLEAAAKQIHHELGCTITVARIAAARALKAAAMAPMEREQIRHVVDVWRDDIEIQPSEKEADRLVDLLAELVATRPAPASAPDGPVYNSRGVCQHGWYRENPKPCPECFPTHSESVDGLAQEIEEAWGDAGTTSFPELARIAAQVALSTRPAPAAGEWPSEEQVEAAARAIYEDAYPPREKQLRDELELGWEHAGEVCKADYRRSAKQALLAATPLAGQAPQGMREALELCTFWLEVAIASEKFTEEELGDMRETVKQADAAISAPVRDVSK